MKTMQNSSSRLGRTFLHLSWSGFMPIVTPSRRSGNQSERDYDALQAAAHAMLRALDAADLKLWAQKWRWYERNSLPWNRARIHYEFARRRAFCRWPIQGNVLEMLREGRLELGEHVVLEPGVWLTAQTPARIRIGGGTFLNLGVQVAAADLVAIGAHCMLANGCFVTDANHRFDDPELPVPWQGFTSKGPTRLGDNVWCGANVVVTSGVTIGERSVIGANSVVTTDIPPYSIAAGAPAKVIRTIEYPAGISPSTA
jgi:acetyltransferase-like isoleucine patch superfamily enzyme